MDEKWISLYGINSDLRKVQTEIEKVNVDFKELHNLLNNITKIEQYAEAYFEAEESTSWIITVHLNLYSDGSVLRLTPYKTHIHEDPRFSYNEWEKQRKNDYPKAQAELKRVAEQWKCEMRPIKEMKE